MRRTVVVSWVLAAVSLSQGAGAQAASALPFRPGQWGAEFLVSTQTIGTLLRFHAPNRAWALGGTFSGNWDWSDTAPPGDRTTAFFEIRASLRRYRPLTTGVVGYWATGGRVTISRDLLPNDTRSLIAAGPLAQVGASWFVLPRLSVGAEAAASLTVSRSRERTTAFGGAAVTRTSTGIGLFAGQFGLVGAIYF